MQVALTHEHLEVCRVELSEASLLPMSFCCCQPPLPRLPRLGKEEPGLTLLVGSPLRHTLHEGCICMHVCRCARNRCTHKIALRFVLGNGNGGLEMENGVGSAHSFGIC